MRDLSSYETGSHEDFERDFSPARGSVEFVEPSREGVREVESLMDGRHSRGW